LKLPRDISGADLARLLRRFGYEITRQTGSHLRLRSAEKGAEHHITIPLHQQLKVGTLSAILGDVAGYLKKRREELIRELFER
jgi:predicted RNA binding protein YcfA (HicA-like mRNA interferase family)